MLTGLAWALRETQGPAAMPAAPPASFRKSRRVVFDRAGCVIHSPLCVTWMALGTLSRVRVGRLLEAGGHVPEGSPASSTRPGAEPTGPDPAPAAMILLPGQGPRQGPLLSAKRIMSSPGTRTPPSRSPPSQSLAPARSAHVVT